MIFNFGEFLNDLRNHKDPNKKEKIENYERIFGPLSDNLEESAFYKEYLSKFDSLPYKIPDELNGVYDWDLLFKLVSASFSTQWELVLSPNEILPELVISVTSGEEMATKCVSELWSFQIFRLYEIFIEENIGLYSIMDDFEEKLSIQAEQSHRIKLNKTKVMQVKILIEIEKMKRNPKNPDFFDDISNN